MSTELVEKSNGNGYELTGFESALFNNDIGKLTHEERVTYALRLCKSLGLNPLSRPFQYIVLKNKLTLYATKDATEQLRKTQGLSLTIVARERIESVYIVTARATLPNGRADEATGAVNIKGLQGDDLANALMKAETKAKRRVTLSICGLGMLDESELETCKDVRPMATTEPVAPIRIEAPAPRLTEPYTGNPWEHKIECECKNTGKALFAVDPRWLDAATKPKNRNQLTDKDYSAILAALESPDLKDEALANASIYDIVDAEEVNHG